MKTLLSLIFAVFAGSAPVQANQGELIVERAKQYLYVRESNGYNRSKEIDTWNRYCGVPLGSAYCASFISYMHKEVGAHMKPSAWAPSVAGSGKRISFENLKSGDAGGIYFPSKRRIGHVFIVDKVKGKYVFTVEANTSPDAKPGSNADRDGDGVHCKIRSAALMKDSRNKFSRYWSE